MSFLKDSSIFKSILFLIATMFSISIMAADFSQTQYLANQGDAIAQYDLGSLYLEGKDVRQDDTKAIEWFEKSASQGNANAQRAIGFAYYTGKRLPQDYTKAKHFFEKAASQGEVNAQYYLGAIYYLGNGVRKNPVIAKEWFGKACKGGDQGGCDGY